jgi:sugar phosphate permease
VMKLCIHPLAGSAGAIAAGWATDRFFRGSRAPVIAILLAVLGISSVLFPYIDPCQTWLIVLIVAIIGFCTYGPHILMVGHAAQDFGRKEGAAGAAGFIDAVGYIGASLAGLGAGILIDKPEYGYRTTFIVFGSAAFLGSLLICIIWKARPDAPAAASGRT